MANPIDYQQNSHRYKDRPNKVEYIRVEVLGMDRPELMAAIRTYNASLTFGTGTLKNIERDDGGNGPNRTKLHTGLNHVLKKADFETVAKDFLYARFE